MANPADNKSVPAAAVPAKPAEIRAFANFLETCGPDSEQYVSGLVHVTSSGLDRVATPEIELHCERDSCNGVRRFQCGDDERLRDRVNFVFLQYYCRNCGEFGKVFALAVSRDGSKNSGTALKLGEAPPYGPPTPSRVMKLVGEDREPFLKGRRNRRQGLLP